MLDVAGRRKKKTVSAPLAVCRTCCDHVMVIGLVGVYRWVGDLH